MITPTDKKVLKKFGENLRKLRKDKGLSLREMSYACSIDNSKIAKIEKGMINITFTTLLQLAVALEAHPSSLVDYEITIILALARGMGLSPGQLVDFTWR